MLRQLKQLLFGVSESGERFLITDPRTKIFCLTGRKQLGLAQEAKVSALLSKLSAKPRCLEVYALRPSNPGAEWFSWSGSRGWNQVSLKALSVENFILSLGDLGYKKRGIASFWPNVSEDFRP